MHRHHHNVTVHCCYVDEEVTLRSNRSCAAATRFMCQRFGRDAVGADAYFRDARGPLLPSEPLAACIGKVQFVNPPWAAAAADSADSAAAAVSAVSRAVVAAAAASTSAAAVNRLTALMRRILLLRSADSGKRRRVHFAKQLVIGGC